jgi:hypothetical protein
MGTSSSGTAHSFLQKIAKLKESLHFIGAPAKNKHIVFVDSKAEAAKFEPEKYLDTPKVGSRVGQGRGANAG